MSFEHALDRLSRLFLDELECVPDVYLLGSHCSNSEANGVPAIEAGLREHDVVPGGDGLIERVV